jgi:protein-S-isoprenylcysteine O-methyltransferase Ste14
METDEPERPENKRGMWGIQAAALVMIAGGVVAGLVWLPAEWSWIRRGLGGLVIGAGTALLILTWRLLVWDDGEE